MKTFKEYLREDTDQEKLDKIIRENEKIIEDISSLLGAIENDIYKLKNGIAYSSQPIRKNASSLESHCKEMISLSKKLKEQR